MRTVLMTTDAVGGVWTYSLELISALDAHSIEVVLAVLGPPPSDAQRAELAASAVAESFELGSTLEWMDDPWASVDAVGDQLLQLEADIDPDIVHLNGYSHAALRWSAPTVVVAHSDVMSWWRAVRGVPAPSSWTEYSNRVTRGLEAASAIVAPTRAVLDGMHDDFPTIEGRVIPNARRGEWVLDMPKEPMVLTAGRLWDEAKNVSSLTAVAPSLDWPVVIAGDDGASAAGCPGVTPLGRLSFHDLSAWLARAAVYTSPARYEPFGLAALEAGMSHCALVLGDIASLREVWGDAALFVPPDDHDALRDALNALARDPQLCLEMAERAFHRSQHFDVALMAGAYVGLYEEVSLVRGGSS